MFKKNKTSGFTLIELLVVVAIVSLLAVIVATALNNSRIKARDTKRKADIRQLYTALSVYQSGPGNGLYPCSTTGCLSTMFRCLDYASTDIDELVAQSIMASLPADPIAERTWVGGGCYNYRSNGSDFKLRVSLEELGPAGDDNSWYELYSSGAADW